MKVLIVYPNLHEPWMPMGITHLSAYLKNAGHEVDLFDLTYYDLGNTTLQRDYKKDGVFKEHAKWYSKTNITIARLHEIFTAAVKKADPDVIMFSIMTHDCLSVSKVMIPLAQLAQPNAMVILGGVVPTVTPEEFGPVNYIVRGEGELAVLDILDGKYKDRKSPIVFGTPIDMDELMWPDWDLMDPALYMKWPFGSSVYTFGRFDRTRGCPNRCTYCIYGSESYPKSMKRVRTKSTPRIINELKHYVEKYTLEYITFNDDNFLAAGRNENYTFLDVYKRDIGLPFIVTLHSATVTLDMAWELADAGCIHASVGVESGDQWIRGAVLRRRIKDDVMISAFDALRRAGIHTSALNMIGLPYEDPKAFRRTINLNRKLKPDKGMCFYFYPYKGTPARKMAIESGVITELVPSVNFSHRSVMTSSYFPWKTMRRYKETFNIQIRFPRLIAWLVGRLAHMSPFLFRQFSKYKADAL